MKNTGKTKYRPLLRRAEDCGYERLADLTEEACISLPTLSSRLSGRADWRSNEIIALCKALKIPSEEIGKYFFPEVEVSHAVR